MKIVSDSYTSIYGFMFVIVVTAAAFLLLVHSMFTSHEVPAGLNTDCGEMVLDPVTHLCGGL